MPDTLICFPAIRPGAKLTMGVQPALPLLIPIADSQTLANLHTELSQIHQEAVAQFANLGLQRYSGTADFHGSLVAHLKFVSPFYAASVKVNIERFSDLYAKINNRLELLARNSRVHPCRHGKYL
jgi:hypothetical protein